ncbi:MAG: HAD family hydrolase [Clostridia bacterium]|nr:HAD family hydrolase [Clostridia bacterium]
MEKKMVIWDWNGTILDDIQICFDIANTMRSARSMPPIPDLVSYRDLFRFPVIEYYRAMGYTFEQESFEEISVDFVTRYLAAYPDCSLRPHAVETATALKGRGIRQGILSATGQDRLRLQVAHFGLSETFDPILGTGDDLAHGKVEVARDFLAGSGYDPGQVVFVGDTDHDLEVANSIGCACILLTGGHHNCDRLAKLGVPVLEDVRQLEEYL